MSNFRKEEYKKTALAVIKFAVPTVALIIAIVACFISLAWFSMNKVVSTEGMLVVPKEMTLASYNGADAFKVIDDIDNITSNSQDGNSITIPGTYAVYKVTLRNETDNDIPFEAFGFMPPTVLKNNTATITANYGASAETVKSYDEFPRIVRSGKEGSYTYKAYYFGTQLMARIIKISLLSEGHNDGDNVAYGTTGLYFYDTPMSIVDENGTINDSLYRPFQFLLDQSAADDPTKADDLPLYGEEYTKIYNKQGDTDKVITIPSGYVVIFYIQIKFENFEASQNDYKGFAFNGGSIQNNLSERCFRSIYVDFANETTEP